MTTAHSFSNTPPIHIPILYRVIRRCVAGIQNKILQIPLTPPPPPFPFRPDISQDKRSRIKHHKMSNNTYFKAAQHVIFLLYYIMSLLGTLTLNQNKSMAPG